MKENKYLITEINIKEGQRCNTYTMIKTYTKEELKKTHYENIPTKKGQTKTKIEENWIISITKLN